MPFSDIPSQQPATEPVARKTTPLIKRLPSHPPWYYRSAISLLKPLYRLQVWKRSHQRENYQQEVAQRFGKQYPPLFKSKINQQTIWCHAVSLGETNTVAPLLDALLAKGYHIWLTNTTQTGFARGASRFADDISQGRLNHSYVPVDSPAVIDAFLAHVQPIAALFVETELWANILTRLSEQDVPSILVNGRLSASSFTRYQKISAVSASMMQNLTLIIAQDNESAKRFRQLGAYSSQIRVAGSLKWVINTPKLVRTDDHYNDNRTELMTANQTDITEPTFNTLLKDDSRPIWVAASTHSGEEMTVLSLHQQLLTSSALADTLLIIVPRHPERFDEVAALIAQSGLQMARRSLDEQVTPQTQVYLADSMGELMQWYALANVALVGGSLVDIGGHNPVEPASVATPIIIGQYTQSCQSVVDKLASVGALYQPNNQYYQAITVSDKPLIENDDLAQKTQAIVTNIDDIALIAQQLQFWLKHTQLAKWAGQAGEQLTEQQQSVLTRQVSMIEKVIEQFTDSET